MHTFAVTVEKDGIRGIHYVEASIASEALQIETDLGFRVLAIRFIK